MDNSVIRSDGTVVWFGEPRSTVEELDDDIFSAYCIWYEGQVRDKEENEHDCIPLLLAS
jgi:hypothetical protein